jgi:hypothetical protein
MMNTAPNIVPQVILSFLTYVAFVAFRLVSKEQEA